MSKTEVETEHSEELQELLQNATPDDSLDDATRREMLKRIVRVGAVAAPTSIALMSRSEAQVVSSPGVGLPGG